MPNLSEEKRKSIDEHLGTAIALTAGKSFEAMTAFLERNYGVSEEEIILYFHPKVLAALDQEYRTLHRIKDFIGLPRAFNISPILVDMVAERIIWNPPGHVVEGYFLWDQKPLKVWMSGEGDGKVKAEFDETYTGIRETEQIYGHNILHDGAAIEDEREEKGEPVAKIKTGKEKIREAISSCFTGNENKDMKQRKEFTRDQIREAASRVGTKKALCAALGISSQGLHEKFKKYPDFATAFDEGVEIYNKNNPAKTISSVSSKEGTNKYDIDLGVLQNLAFQGKSQNAAADHFVVPRGTFAWMLSNKGNPQYRRAWDKGLELRKLEEKKTGENEVSKTGEGITSSDESVAVFGNPFAASEEPRTGQPDLVRDDETESFDEFFDGEQDEKILAADFLDHRDDAHENAPTGLKIYEPKTEIIADPRFVHALEHIGANGHSREKFEEVKEKLLSMPPLQPPRFFEQPADQPAPEKRNFKQINLSGGGKVTIDFDGNVFDLPANERFLLMNIIETIELYEEDKNGDE